MTENQEKAKKEFEYRVKRLIEQGKSEDDAHRIATKEISSISDARRQYYRDIAQRTIKRHKNENQKVTTTYGQKGRVGKSVVIQKPRHISLETQVKKEPLSPEIPSHQVDAVGRQQPSFISDGAFSIEVERIETTARRIKRDGTFRDRVLGTYGAACVICGYAVHVEAAHLDPKHQVSDDRTENGAPLCPNCHWELDHGHLTPDEVRRKRDAS